ncbi:Uncharacterised protein [Sebaldella termitidis]|uniref:Phage repressor n=1 Tax=Sebaldella termitidis (strain ATCC 33386 / NCTC 11300) TaxID=526218 RepID=D1ANA3_SEBTE|nr:XRE family transcriptional regulator [Sebaldella termitidis]ACZ09707.1 putative phage repressor [Sebaldella termitidis ATCC 33386]SUI25038.1 Uncharacterised protein [Sebaldella termitidis]
MKKNFNSFADYLKNFIKERDYTLESLAEDLNVSFGSLSHYTTGKRIPKDVFIDNFASYFNLSKEQKNEIKALIELDRSPFLKDRIKLHNKKETPRLTVFSLNTAGEGLLQELSKEVFVLPADLEIYEDSFIVEIRGDKLAPEILNGDRILVESFNFNNWRELDGKIVVIDIKNEKFAKRVGFYDGEAILKSLTGYEKNILVDENIKYVGTFTTLVSRKLF